MDIITHDGKTYSLTGDGTNTRDYDQLKEDIEELSGKGLVGFYNTFAEKLGQSAVKRFADHKSGLRRTLDLMVQCAAIIEEEKPVKAARKTRGMSFNYAFKGAEQLRTIKNPMSLRAVVLSELEKGATFEEVVDTVEQFDNAKGREPKNLKQRAYEVIHLLNHYVGYGLRQDAEGRIFAHTNG